MDVAIQLRTARAAAGLSQAQLAALTGVGRISISRYERGAVMPAADVYLRLLWACRHRPHPPLEEHDLALVDAQLARAPEARLHAAQELSRLRAQAHRPHA